MKRGCVFLIILLQSFCAFVQIENTSVCDSVTNRCKQILPTLTIDRPDQTDSPYVIPVGYFQLETGFQQYWDHYQVDSLSYSYRSLTYPNLLIRYGIRKNVELRIEANYGKESLQIVKRSEVSKSYGFYPLLFSAKINLWQQKGLRPNFALLVKLFTPLHSRKAQAFAWKFTPGLAGAFSHSFSNKFVLDGSADGFIDQTSGRLTAHYSLSHAVGLTTKLSIFSEIFSVKPSYNAAQYGADAGILFLFSPHIQVDIFASKAISYQAIDLFIGTGIGIRFLQK